MDPATLALLAGMIAVSSAGAIYTNNQNIKFARSANSEAINLANTAHQREVADLRAAGLNPILSASGSGAQVPQLKTPSLENPLESLASNATSFANAVNGMTRAEIETAQAEASSARSFADVASAESLPQRLESYARQEAMTGVPVSEAWDLVSHFGDPDRYSRLIELYENEIDSGAYLNSKGHAIFNDVRGGLDTVIQGVNSANSWRRSSSAIRRDNFEMSKPLEHESFTERKIYDSKGKHRGTIRQRRRHN